MSHDVLKNDIKQLASMIELLAKEVQNSIDNDQHILSLGNELVKNSTTLVFTLGSLYQESQHFECETFDDSKETSMFKRDKLGRFSKWNT